jgi:hypothetical protein
MPDRVAYSQPQAGPQGFARTMKCYGADVAILAADLALNKTVGMFKVPAGFVLTSLAVTVTDMDTNGAPAVKFDIGDAGSANRFVVAATTAQAGGTTTTLDAAGLNYEFTADTEIVWKTNTAAATAAAGTAQVRFFGYIK